MEAQAFELHPVARIIWMTTLGITLLVFAPLTWYLLHRTWRAARQIQTYTERALASGVGIAGNTGAVSRLQTTLGVVSEMLEIAGAIAERTGRLKSTLLGRVGGSS